MKFLTKELKIGLTGIIALAIYCVAACKIDEILYNTGFALRRARHTGYGIELLPYQFGFKVSDGHTHNMLFVTFHTHAPRPWRTHPSPHPRNRGARWS